MHPEIKGGPGPLEFKTRRKQTLNHHLAPLGVHGNHALDTALIAPQRCNSGRLDGFEDPRIHIALDGPQGLDNGRIAHRETQSPAGHIVGLGMRVELDAHVLGTVGRQKARRGIPVVGHLRIRRVMANQDPVFSGKIHDALEE